LVYELIAQVPLLAGELLRHRFTCPKAGGILGHNYLSVSCVRSEYSGRLNLTQWMSYFSSRLEFSAQFRIPVIFAAHWPNASLYSSKQSMISPTLLIGQVVGSRHGE